MSRIITFYSYKGGVGRTFALANIAVLLAKRGKRVLLMDWDLEAPGLHRYFKPYLSSDLPMEKGLIHLLGQAVENPQARWEPFVTEILIDNSPSIHMISSGDQSADYVEQVRAFSWVNFFENRYGAEVLDRWRTEWKNSYDFVLVDSRTGITDTGGVCTVFLPDILVLVFSANEQSFERGIQIVLGVQEARCKLAVRRPPAAILPLPSRFDGRDEVDEANRWLDQFSRDLKPFYDDWLPKKFKPRQILELTKIPYITKFSFGEPLPVLSHSISDPEFPGFYLENVTRLLATDFQDVALILTPAGSEEKSVIAEFRAQLAQLQIDETAVSESLSLVENELGENAALSELLNEAGIVFLRQKHFDSAETYFRRALDISERELGSEHPNTILSLNHLAELLYSTKHLLEAEQIYRRVLRLLENANKPATSVLATTYISLATVVCELGRLSEAEDIYRLTIRLLEKASSSNKITNTKMNENRLENERKKVTILNLLSDVYQRQGKFDEVADTLRQIVDMEERLGNKRGQAMALNLLGGGCQRQGKFDEAVDILRQSLALFVQSDDERGQMMVLSSVGEVYQRLGKLGEAVDAFQQSYIIAVSLNDKRNVVVALNSLGKVYQQLGKFNEAADALQQSASIEKQLENEYGQATTLNSLGEVYQRQCKFEEAIDVLHQSNALWKRLGDERGLAIAMNLLGRVYQEQSKFEEAVDFLRQSNVLWERLGDERGQAMALNSLGEVYLQLGKFEEAADTLRQSDALWARLGDKRRHATVLNLLGDVYQRQGKFDEAKKHFRQSASIGGFEKAVFVSYAWGGESEQTVDELERAFAERGIRVVRDKKDLGYKGSIEAFEQRIGQGQCIILVVSDKYLRSEHCMYELVEADKNRNLRDRIFPIMLADAKIYKAIDRLSYIKYWNEKIERLNQAIKQVDVMTNLAGITADLDKYASIRASFDHLTDLLSDMNILTPEIHAASGFSTLISATEHTMAG